MSIFALMAYLHALPATCRQIIRNFQSHQISGTGIPLVFKKLHVDPAVASDPLITTINDLVAVVTYYGLAWLLLVADHLHVGM